MPDPVSSRKDFSFNPKTRALWREPGNKKSYADELKLAAQSRTWDEVLDIFGGNDPQSTSLQQGRIRVIAMGDMHGCRPDQVEVDLKRVGFLDEQGNVFDKFDFVFVQMGDIADRGHHSLEVYDYLASLQEKAPGRVIRLFANHDLYHLAGVPQYIHAAPIKGLQDRLLKDVLEGKVLLAWAEGDTGTSMDTIYTHAGIDLKFFPEFVGKPNREIVEVLNTRFRNAVEKFSNELKSGDTRSRSFIREASNRFLDSDPIFDSENGVMWTRGKIENEQFRQVVGHTPMFDGIEAAPGLRVKYIDAGRVFGEQDQLNPDRARILMANTAVQSKLRYLASHPEIRRQFEGRE